MREKGIFDMLNPTPTKIVVWFLLAGVYLTATIPVSLPINTIHDINPNFSQGHITAAIVLFYIMAALIVHVLLTKRGYKE